MWIAAIFLGECLAILGELQAAKDRLALGTVLALVGVPLLLYGYWLGVRTGTVWKVTAVSVGSILIAEPVLVWLVFREAPSRGELAGCLLGAAGMVVANWK